MAATKSNAPMSSRYSNLKKSFHLGVRSILTAVAKDDVEKAFPSFTGEEKGKLYRMFIQIIKSLHEKIEEEFDSICQETQVGAILDNIEQLLEEQNLDSLASDRTYIGVVKEKILGAKKDEIQYLTNIIERTEEQNTILSARIKSLKEQQPDVAVTAGFVDKFRSWNSNLERRQDTLHGAAR